MKETEIRTYAALMRELDLTGLEITDDRGKVRLERLPGSEPGPQLPAALLSSEPPTAAAPSDHISVTSPLIGVFYGAPAENAEPYVTIGDHVRKGQTLCIVEAMKLMNEIIAEEDGIVSDICVSNGQVVEYGTELFRLRR